jgi:hypothetical protein
MGLAMASDVFCKSQVGKEVSFKLVHRYTINVHLTATHTHQISSAAIVLSLTLFGVHITLGPISYPS